MDRTRETYFQGGESLRKEVSKEELCGDGRSRRTLQARRKPLVKTQMQEGECSRDWPGPLVESVAWFLLGTAQVTISLEVLRASLLYRKVPEPAQFLSESSLPPHWPRKM